MAKIVIEITDKNYADIKNGVVQGTDFVSALLIKAVREGIPLKAIKDEMEGYMNDCAITSIYTRSGFQTSLNVINKYMETDKED